MRISVGIGRETIEDYEELAVWAQEAEKVGVDSIWTAEAWAHDAATPLAWLAAKTERIKLGTGIFQIGTRTPALVGMTSQALDRMSGGRFLLGLGTSGPQVIEGYHGVPFDRPITRTRELIEIVRMVTRGMTVEYRGKHYLQPIPGGEGKALRSGGQEVDLKIYLASIGPRNLELTGELCDGWLAASFVPDRGAESIAHIEAGAKRAGRSLDDIDLAAGGSVWITDDVDEAYEQRKRGIAFSVGAMGSRANNFYNRGYARQGFADEMQRIQSLWLDGKRDEARAAVPDELVRLVSLVGDEDMVKERLRAYRDVGINTFRLGVQGATLQERVDNLGRAVDLVNAVSAEVPSQV